MKCLSFHSAYMAQNHKITDCIGHTFAGHKYRAKKLILPRAKNMFKSKPQYQKHLKIVFFMHALKKNILLNLQP